MADFTREQLKKEIEGILKGSDLSEMTAKKVRQRLEEKFDADFIDRKEEIDELVMNYVDAQEEEESDEDEEESEPEVKPKAKKPAPKRAPPKRKPKDSDEEDGSDASDKSEDDDEDDDETYNAKKAPVKKKAKKNKDSEDDSDSDWGKKNKKAAKKGGGGGGGKGKGSGYTKAMKLSPELSQLMGEASMARHEVVKKMWALIKERNLYDPNNKQYAICDSDLYKVIGVKRFRTFGMMKYLKSHFRS